MNEHVLPDETFLIGSFQLSFEGQSAAHLAINFKVAQGLAGLLETLGVWDDDNCGVEWSVNVASDLGLAVKYVTSFVLNDHGNLIGRGFFLWQVVQVEVVLSFSLITHLHFLFFCFVYEGNLSKFFFVFWLL